MRAVIADDNLLVREGVAALLLEGGVEVVAQAGNAEDLLREADTHQPDVAVVDIRMPPTHTDEGLRAAQELRLRHPLIGILIVSQHVEIGVAMQVLAENPERLRLGYLLKDRIIEMDDFVGTLRRVAAGGSALDPLVVSRLIAGSRDDGPLSTLTPREREVLARGRGPVQPGNRRTAGHGRPRHPEALSSIFEKLKLQSMGGEHRRVLGVLESLHS